MNQPDRETIEIDLLLEALHRQYGYDFRSYARASVERRVQKVVRDSGVQAISELIPRCLHDPGLFATVAQAFSITVTEMFRDPHVFRALRESVLPYLATFSGLRVWNPGCATGEEVYSVAVILSEAGLLDRCTIFGTDFNDNALDTARRGIYSLDTVKEATLNYQESGGTRSFSEYYHASYDAARIDPALKERITFANHNLTADGVFGEMHMVVCRNVMIYFNRDLQNRAMRLFSDSLVRGGYLVVGTKEDIQFTDSAGDFAVVDRAARIYKRV